MKSPERAEAKCKSTMNNSGSKYQYSFGHEKRFKQKSYLSTTNINFYNLPSQISKRGTVFGTSKRTIFNIKNENPAPTKYEPKQISSKSYIQFAKGRQECKSSSIFNSSVLLNPGPGDYNPEIPINKQYFTIKGKEEQKYDTISPGPKYNFQSLILDKNKFLSTEIRKGSIRLVLPSSQSRIKTEYTESRGNLAIETDAPDRVWTRNGKRKIGTCGRKAIMTMEKRFASTESKLKVPGPGYQYNQCYTSKSFSEFIDEKEVK